MLSIDDGGFSFRCSLAAAFAAPALAQQPAAPAPAASPARQARPQKAAKHKPARRDGPLSRRRRRAAAVAGVKPTLLGQYGDWGAYTASPGGKKVCFAIAKPASSETNPPGGRAIRPICSFPRGRRRR